MEAKKPIVFLIRNISPENYGGAESYQLELAKILLQNDYVPIIYTASKRLLENAKAEGIKTVRAPYIERQNWSGWRNILLPQYFIHQNKLYKWYKEQILKYHPITIDVQSRDEWIAATKAGRKTGTKVLWTDHIDLRTWVLQNINHPLKNIIGKKIIKSTSAVAKIIFITDYEKCAVKKMISPKQLPNAVVMKNGVVDEKQNIKQQTQPKSFCYVGRLIDYKGLQELIEAFRKINSEFSDSTLNIYGEGPDGDKFRQMAQDNKNIIFHGYTNKPLDAIAKSEIFILPSYYEGLSITLLQAAMLGKAIIATNVDGNPEVVSDHETGLLVPSRDSEALAKAMRELLLDDKLRHTVAKNVRKKYEQEFDFTNIIKKQFIQYLK